MLFFYFGSNMYLSDERVGFRGEREERGRGGRERGEGESGEGGKMGRCRESLQNGKRNHRGRVHVWDDGVDRVGVF